MSLFKNIFEIIPNCCIIPNVKNKKVTDQIHLDTLSNHNHNEVDEEVAKISNDKNETENENINTLSHIEENKNSSKTKFITKSNLFKTKTAKTSFSSCVDNEVSICEEDNSITNNNISLPFTLNLIKVIRLKLLDLQLTMMNQIPKKTIQ